mmetsp:Transcript_94674/g.203252  ORF Transcript_94674/g.203252 Transcript_94674/m.203252 type:complete len:227 (-) Transcript_94674:267-947(-)
MGSSQALRALRTLRHCRAGWMPSPPGRAHTPGLGPGSAPGSRRTEIACPRQAGSEPKKPPGLRCATATSVANPHHRRRDRCPRHHHQQKPPPRLCSPRALMGAAPRLEPRGALPFAPAASRRHRVRTGSLRASCHLPWAFAPPLRRGWRRLGRATPRCRRKPWPRKERRGLQRLPGGAPGWSQGRPLRTPSNRPSSGRPHLPRKAQVIPSPNSAARSRRPPPAARP